MAQYRVFCYVSQLKKIKAKEEKVTFLIWTLGWKEITKQSSCNLEGPNHRIKGRKLRIMEQNDRMNLGF